MSDQAWSPASRGNSNYPRLQPPAVLSGKQRSQAYKAKIIAINAYYKQKSGQDRYSHNQAVVDVLIDVRKSEAYLDEGFKNMREWIEESFPKGRRHCLQILANADFHMVIFGVYHLPVKMLIPSDDKLEDRRHVPEGVSREITCLPDTEWKSVWEAAKEIARHKEYYGEAILYHKDKVTSVIARQATQEWKAANGMPVKEKVEVKMRTLKQKSEAQYLFPEQSEMIDSLTREQKINLFTELREMLWPSMDLTDVLQMQEEKEYLED